MGHDSNGSESADESVSGIKRVLLAFNNLMDFTLTEVALCLIEWAEYYANHPTIRVDILHANKWGFQRNFNEFIRYAIENGYDYVFQYDADMTGDKRVIERLIGHDKECVGCLYFSRGNGNQPQIWQVTAKDNGEIDHFNAFSHDAIRVLMNSGRLVKTDVRSSGFTLFKTESVKELGYPYGESKPNNLDPYSINGFDMDITWKLTKKYGGVWTDLSPENAVNHITYDRVNIGRVL